MDYLCFLYFNEYDPHVYLILKMYIKLQNYKYH